MVALFSMPCFQRSALATVDGGPDTLLEDHRLTAGIK